MNQLARSPHPHPWRRKLHIPNSILNQRPLVKLSAAEKTEDQVQIELGSYSHRGRSGNRAGIPPVPAKSSPIRRHRSNLRFRGDAVQYPIRYWLSDYAEQSAFAPGFSAAFNTAAATR